MTTSYPTSAVVIGASGGIGGAMVRALAERATHAPIFALSRSASSVPQGVRTLPIDLSDEATVAAAAARVGEAGPVGLIIQEQTFGPCLEADGPFATQPGRWRRSQRSSKAAVR